MQTVSDALNVTIRINKSIEGWAPVTVISPISGQQGTTVINIGHLDERYYVSAVQLDYYNDSISGYEKQTFHKGKASNPEHIRELNRKAQNHLRKAMSSSSLNQTEIPQGQDSIRHSM